MTAESDQTIKPRGGERKELPSRKYLQECFTYDPDEGMLYWGWRPREHFAREVGWKIWTTRWAGKPAGDGFHFKANGERKYVNVGINILGRGIEVFPVTRLICVLMGVKIPKGHVVDHINHDIWDNRWCNLRVITHQQNQCNCMGQSRWGLPKGVSRIGKRFRATITANGVRMHLGIFATPEEAAAIYQLEAKKHFGEFACFKTKVAHPRFSKLGPPMIFMQDDPCYPHSY